MYRLFVVLSFLVLIGCATVVRGTKQKVSISSEPAGALVIIGNIEYGNTPLVTELSRKVDHNVTLELEGYEPYVTIIVSQKDMAMAGNALAGGCIGLGVDAKTGAGRTLNPDNIYAKLSKLE